jgi:RNA polymerase sigma-70 factor (ECF subfamily)
MMTTLTVSPALLAAAGQETRRGAGLREDDRSAVEACRSGDTRAFDRLVERYQRDVYRLCYRYVNNHFDASDMAQEVFLRAYKALAKFRGDSAFSTWLYRIAVNTCLNFRSARRLPGEELSDNLSDRRRSALEEMEREERAGRVREAITHLPEKQRATLILRMYHDLSMEEIAGVMGSSVGTVKANLFHALSKMKKRLGAEEEE